MSVKTTLKKLFNALSKARESMLSALAAPRHYVQPEENKDQTHTPKEPK